MSLLQSQDETSAQFTLTRVVVLSRLVLFCLVTVILMPLPMFHIYGMVIGMIMPAYVQSKTVLMSSFDLVKYFELIQEHRVTRTFIVPPILLALAKHPIIDNYDLSSLKAVSCGAAPSGDNITTTVEDRLNCVVKQGFGMTELSPVSRRI